MGQGNKDIEIAILRRMAEEKPEYISDLNKPIPFGTLSRQEFSVAMQLRWIAQGENGSKKYYFTNNFTDALKNISGARPQQERSAPRAQPQPREKQPQPAPESNIPLEELASIPQGENQVKIMEVIYRGTNKLMHPSMLLLGKTCTGEVRRIERGIPLDIAKSMCKQPNRFNGKVISIDGKGNFVGVVLAQVLEDHKPTNIPEHRKEEAGEPKKDVAPSTDTGIPPNTEIPAESARTTPEASESPESREHDSEPPDDITLREQEAFPTDPDFGI